MAKPNPIPDGYRTITPYLVFDDAAAAIDFYKTAFGATERMRMEAPGGKIGHAEIEIGDSMVMLSDSFPQSTTTSPSELGGTTAGVFLYVEDVDAVTQRRSTQVPPSPWRSPTSSGAIASARSRTRLATRGRSRPMSRTSRQTRSPNGRRKRWRR
jgi:predicted enzyme related to lactoylglutathione lyase